MKKENEGVTGPPGPVAQAETESERLRQYDVDPLTQYDVAENFAKHQHDAARYDAQRGRWYIYNPARGVWEPDAANEISLLVGEHLRKIHRLCILQAMAMKVDAKKAQETDEAALDAKSRKKAEKAGDSRIGLVLRLMTKGQIAGVADLAKARMTIGVDAFDQQPHLINCLNGVIDLRSGRLLPHAPGFMLTRQAPIRYEAEAKLREDDQVEVDGVQRPTFLGFLRQTFAGEHQETLLDFLHVLSGYGISGEVRERKFIVLFGEGNNGKSVFVQILCEMLGLDYMRPSATSTFLTIGNRRAIRADLAALVGSRIVNASEGNRGDRLDTALIKRLAGGKVRMPAESKFKDPFEFVPTFKILMDTNYLPHAPGDDGALYNRMLAIEFPNRVVGDAVEVALADRLIREEREAIFAWLVAGARRYYQEGLVVPAFITKVAAERRRQCSPIEEFYFDQMVRVEDDGKFLLVQTVYDRFREWMEEQGHRSHELPKLDEFSEVMTKRLGLNKKQKTAARRKAFIGVQFADTALLNISKDAGITPPKGCESLATAPICCPEIPCLTGCSNCEEPSF